MTHDQHNKINARLQWLERQAEASQRQTAENTAITKALLERAPSNVTEIIRKLHEEGKLDFLDVTTLPEKKKKVRK